MNYDSYNIMISLYFFEEWQFHVGSFCLVRHEGIYGLPPEECTLDKYWKARIAEIRKPKTKSNTPVSTVVVKCLACTSLPHTISGALFTRAMVLL
jgi:hypothetical protein